VGLCQAASHSFPYLMLNFPIKGRFLGIYELPRTCARSRSVHAPPSQCRLSSRKKYSLCPCDPFSPRDPCRRVKASPSLTLLFLERRVLDPPGLSTYDTRFRQIFSLEGVRYSWHPNVDTEPHHDVPYALVPFFCGVQCPSTTRREKLFFRQTIGSNFGRAPALD